MTDIGFLPFCCRPRPGRARGFRNAVRPLTSHGHRISGWCRAFPRAHRFFEIRSRSAFVVRGLDAPFGTNRDAYRPCETRAFHRFGGRFIHPFFPACSCRRPFRKGLGDERSGHLRSCDLGIVGVYPFPFGYRLLPVCFVDNCQRLVTTRTRSDSVPTRNESAFLPLFRGWGARCFTAIRARFGIVRRSCLGVFAQAVCGFEVRTMRLMSRHPRDASGGHTMCRADALRIKSLGHLARS